MTPGVALLVIGGILLISGFKNRNIVDVALGRETREPEGNVPAPTGAVDASTASFDNSKTVKAKGKSGDLLHTIADAAPAFGCRATEHPDYGGLCNGDGSCHSANSLHKKGRAVDIVGTVDAMDQFAAWVNTNHPNVTELIWNGPHPQSRKNGIHVIPAFWGATTWAGHTNHVHVGV